jgi:hypothetical protein
MEMAQEHRSIGMSPRDEPCRVNSSSSRNPVQANVTLLDN